jgi:hypothetical protein
MFTRTKFGLSNEHQFYRVELVVYCEGDTVEGESASLDEVFWTKVFECNGRVVKCKSLGGKPTLRPLAEKVANGEIDNVVVAMDRDYDHLRGLKIFHPKVIYTFGYSWESDVMLRFDFDLAISIFANITNTIVMRGDYDKFRSKQTRVLRRLFAIDFKYIAHSKSLFDRGKPLSIVACGAAKEPYIKTILLVRNAKILGKFQTGKLPVKEYATACGVRDFYGKTVSRLVYHWFVYRTSKMASKRSIPYEAFMSLLTSNLDFSDTSIDRNAHYAELLSAI